MSDEPLDETEQTLTEEAVSEPEEEFTESEVIQVLEEEPVPVAESSTVEMIEL